MNHILIFAASKVGFAWENYLNFKANSFNSSNFTTAMTAGFIFTEQAGSVSALVALFHILIMIFWILFLIFNRTSEAFHKNTMLKVSMLSVALSCIFHKLESEGILP
jgi:hypothetical protein